MSGELRDFEADSVTVTWVLPTGAIALHVGLMDGPNSIQDAQDRPRATRKTDRQGNQVRNKTKSRAGNLTLSYQAEAQILKVITGIIQGEDSTGLSAIGPIVVANLNGDEIITYAGCAIDSEPGIGFGDVASDRVITWGYAKRKPLMTGLEAVGA